MPSSYTLGPHFEGFIKTMVESGRYASASEVMRDSLRLQEREKLREAKLAALRADIQDGELESGPAELLDMAEIKATARRERAAKASALSPGA